MRGEFLLFKNQLHEIILIYNSGMPIPETIFYVVFSNPLPEK